MGHNKADCKEERKCRYCLRKHEDTPCDRKGDTANYECCVCAEVNETTGVVRNIKHAASSPNCPEVRKRRRTLRIREQTDANKIANSCLNKKQ